MTTAFQRRVHYHRRDLGALVLKILGGVHRFFVVLRNLLQLGVGDLLDEFLNLEMFVDAGQGLHQFDIPLSRDCLH